MSGDLTTQAVDEVTGLDHFRSLVWQRYPGASWITRGGHGRIIEGDRLISVAVPLIDPDAEWLAWLDASCRLGDGDTWRACHGKAD